MRGSEQEADPSKNEKNRATETIYSCCLTDLSQDVS